MSPVGKLNKDKAVAKAAEEKAESGGGNSFFSLNPGKNRVRILPPPPGSEDVWYKTGTHWGVGPNKDNFNCAAAADKNAECYLCDVVFKLSKSKNDDDQAVADSIRVKKSWLYNIVDLSDTEAGIQVMAVGAQAHGGIRAYIEDEDGDYGDITDLEEGFNLTIKKLGKGMKTKYEVKSSRNPSPVPAEIAELLESDDPTDLATVRPIAPNAKQKAAFEGDEDDDDDDDDEDDEPTVRKSRKAKAKPAPVEEDEDDDDDEDEKPVTKKAGKKAKAKPAPVVEDDDEEDDDEEEEESGEEEEEAAPKGRIGSALKRKRAGR